MSCLKIFARNIRVGVATDVSLGEEKKYSSANNNGYLQLH